jgi:hypothetical protein
MEHPAAMANVEQVLARALAAAPRTGETPTVAAAQARPAATRASPRTRVSAIVVPRMTSHEATTVRSCALDRRLKSLIFQMK